MPTARDRREPLGGVLPPGDLRERDERCQREREHRHDVRGEGPRDWRKGAHDEAIRERTGTNRNIGVMVGSTVLLPWLVIQMPPDYFLKGHRHPLARRERHWTLHVALVLGKNLLGLVMVLAGIAMLALPGQGILTILAGLMVMDFPGKYHLEGAIIRRRAVRAGGPLRTGCALLALRAGGTLRTGRAGFALGTAHRDHHVAGLLAGLQCHGAVGREIIELQGETPVRAGGHGAALAIGRHDLLARVRRCDPGSPPRRR